MTKGSSPFPIFVSPAKAGVQFQVFKKEGSPTNDVYIIMDSLVMPAIDSGARDKRVSPKFSV